MRITRVTKIRGHRVFRDFLWPNDLHSFGQFNLIYGWNGCGKTTLSSLFAHIEKKENVTEGEVEFEIDGGRTCLGYAIAGTNLPPVRVFNRDFINATIASTGDPSDRIDPIYYLGEDSIEKQAQVNRLKEELDTANDELTNATSAKTSATRELDEFRIDEAKVIKRTLTGAKSSRYNNYDKRNFTKSVAMFDAQADVRAARLTGEETEQLLTQKNSQLKSELSAVVCTPPDFENFRSRVKSLLERSVASETIEELAQNPAIARWVQEGLAVHSGEQKTSTCRFCSQPLTTERRAALEGHFNDAFAAFQRELASEISLLARAAEDLAEITFPHPASTYEHLQEELAAAISAAQKTIELTIAWITEVRTALESKRAAPFAPAQCGCWQSETPTVDGSSPDSCVNRVECSSVSYAAS